MAKLIWSLDPLAVSRLGRMLAWEIADLLL